MSRGGSVGFGSIDSFKLSPFHLKAGEPHPEEWTLVGNHKMEKREAFHAWYVDLQANIVSCARQMNTLLAHHPHPNVQLTKDDVVYSHHVIEEEADRLINDVNSRYKPILNQDFHGIHTDEDIRLYKGIR